ncbi:MAG: hypothetical protein WEB30_13200 [Cyclobacteriaceae bacterium]
MKIKGILLATFSLLGICGAFAQVEYDDMYFNSEDRAKLKAQGTTELAYNTPTKSKQIRIEEESANPTDSYSARNVSPEYTARQQSETAQADEENYFVDNYQYNRIQLNDWNNNYNNWYNSSWYRSNYYGTGINTWNSPYYGYNRCNSPWYDPYWSHTGWSSSFSYHYGNSWNYGWGGSYNYWNRPYYGWNNPYYGWDPYMGMYGGSYWNNYRYPSTIVVVNPGDRGDAFYGKRPTRGTSIVSDRSNVRSRTSVTNAVRNDANSGGRISTQNRKQDEYYNRYNSRQRSAGYPSSTYDSRSNTQNNRSRSWDNSSMNNSNNNRSYERSSSPTSSPSYSPSSSGGGTRTNTGGSTSGGRGRD